MEHTIENRDGTCLITIKGDFTFIGYEAFLSIVNRVKAHPPTLITLDLTHVDFIDSSALGMLLMLREEQEALGGSIVLRHARGQVKKMFALGRFDELFALED